MVKGKASGAAFHFWKSWPRKLWILLLVTPVSVVLDQITKLIVTQRFSLGARYPLIDSFLDFTLSTNRGVAFGAFGDSSPPIRILFVLIFPALLVLFLLRSFKDEPDKATLSPIGYGLLLGGAIGNGMDRVGRGEVTDFILVHWKESWFYPAFNVADIAICVGVGILILQMSVLPLIQEGKKKKQSRKNR